MGKKDAGRALTFDEGRRLFEETSTPLVAGRRKADSTFHAVSVIA